LVVDFVAGAVFRAVPVPRTAEAVVVRRALVACAGTDRFAAPAFAVPVDFAAVDLTAVDLAVVGFAAAAVFFVAAVFAVADAVVDFAALDLVPADAPALLAVDALLAAALVPALLVVVTPAARLAAGLVVALLATAIVFSPLSESPAGRSTRALRERLRLLSAPAGVLRIPSLVSFSYSVERTFGFLCRGIRPESVDCGAGVLLGLDTVMQKTPVVLVSTAAAHVITVHRKSAVRHRFL
jgi:hypothetical protein